MKRTSEAFELLRTVATTVKDWERRTWMQWAAMKPFAPVTRTVDLRGIVGIVSSVDQRPSETSSLEQRR